MCSAYDGSYAVGQGRSTRGSMHRARMSRHNFHEFPDTNSTNFHVQARRPAQASDRRSCRRDTPGGAAWRASALGSAPHVLLVLRSTVHADITSMVKKKSGLHAGQEHDLMCSITDLSTESRQLPLANRPTDYLLRTYVHALLSTPSPAPGLDIAGTGGVGWTTKCSRSAGVCTDASGTM